MTAGTRRSPHSLYIHIPFCRHRCAYCDFNTYAGKEGLLPAYVDALCSEISQVGAGLHADAGFATVYFGGGTPSLLDSAQADQVLRAVSHSFDLQKDAEIGMEANPGSLTRSWLISAREAGVNRLSLGVQSANGEELHMLERQHTYLDVLQAVAYARDAGFENLNVDLIYGLPGQGLATWQKTVGRILALQPEHISAYALGIEHGTPFGHWVGRGLLPLPDGDLAADMYEWLSDSLQAAGYRQYEISNWSRPGFECRHNMQYWRGGQYLGCGAGAHGYVHGYRYSNVLGIMSYISRLRELAATGTKNVGSALRGNRLVSHRDRAGADGCPDFPAAATVHPQSWQDEISEFMIMGLRLTQVGVRDKTFSDRFGASLAEVWGQQVAELTSLGLLEQYYPTDSDQPGAINSAGTRASTAIRLSPRGRLLGNEVFQRFIA